MWQPPGSTGQGSVSTRHSRAWAISALLSALVVSVVALLAVTRRPVHSQSGEISPEVLQAVRLLLSDDPREEARGERALKVLGAKAAPQLRYWVHKVKQETERVERLLAQVEGRSPSPPSPERLTAREFFDRKLLDCRGLIRKGEFRQALALSEAILLLDPDHSCSWEFRRLARRAKERLVSSQILEPSVDTDKLVYEVGEKPEILFRVQNHDSSVARIRLDRGVLGELSLTVTRRYLDGSVKRNEDRLRIEVSDDVDQILIGPGRSWEHPIRFDATEGFPPRGVVARVEIAGRFRPTRWAVDRARDENITLPMHPTELWIVPEGHAASCDRPLEHLTAAIFFNKLDAFFVSGQIAVWVGEEDAHFNQVLVETLVASLDELSPTASQLADRFLVQATGQQFDGDPSRWREWWSRTVTNRTPGEPSARPGGDGGRASRRAIDARTPGLPDPTGPGPQPSTDRPDR